MEPGYDLLSAFLDSLAAVLLLGSFRILIHFVRSHSRMRRLNFLGSSDLLNLRACSSSGGALVGSTDSILSTAARSLSLNCTMFSFSFCLIV